MGKEKVMVSKRALSKLYLGGHKKVWREIDQLCTETKVAERVFDRVIREEKREVRHSFAYYICELSPEQLKKLKEVERRFKVKLLPSDWKEDLEFNAF